ncbi:MAG: type II secretion system protein [Planctomycetota bacterium]|nr:type II secretion system protein [Planctomycetota bacterium]
MRRGFTLVELIAVIVVLATLSVVAVGRYYNYRDRATRDVAQSLYAGLTQARLDYIGQFGTVPSTFSSWVALDELGGSDGSTFRVTNAVRSQLEAPTGDVLINSGTTLRFEFANGLVAEYVISPSGAITATYTGP